MLAVMDVARLDSELFGQRRSGVGTHARLDASIGDQLIRSVISSSENRCASGANNAS